uniref:C2H2-type domain-containing protein n=1 Tax=Pseudo-nitzschia australis TaxID=44445 RepID=A0A7S4ELP0_9STRA|mmetsp:Transcript_2200/g.4702  ORF Transcript_2200/g.4702 Transcript_2200/m.4702 type:complete len:439 (-) Transcript_2200:231-1547(-)|eukprot:CAMPEP_0168184244 /NCGR_PEP_ID=MMETSP0139_2-20121125/13109_1 /TAXON_ID=44445 /ORGANISM="Pseudo-nitzschia australis, Strain 10249 10 AB" /LENGTH=438 /DNA_ID=CAMNT_0008105799 /DNA_START=178 /DNA_END=1494 /DNA_ORIENTATION=-
MPYTARINTPINHVQLTNVAVVRMNKGGKRFEIACYRNKVVNYRQGLELDLSEVVQTERVFVNVSKGEVAKAKDMQKVFGTKDEDEILKLILSKGQLQVSDLERSQQLEKTFAQIAEWISKNCVQPATDRPYTRSQIRHAMKEANVSIHPTKPLKRQYLDSVKLLQKVMPIQRAKMELLLVVSPEDKTETETILKENNVSSSGAKETPSILKYQILVDPSLYRILSDAMQKMSGARIEIVNQVVTKQGDVNLEEEVGNNKNTIAVDSNQDIGSQAAQLMSKVNIYSKNNDDDSDEDSAIEDTNVSRRKSQKRNNKKNRKAKRRNQIEDTDTNNNYYNARSNGEFRNQPGVLEQSGEGSVEVADNIKTSVATDRSDPSGRKSCNTCGGFFDTASEFRAHFKSDWHRFNQKLKMKGFVPVSEKEFLLCDSSSFFENDSIL